MPRWLEKILASIYSRIPARVRPIVKRAYFWAEIRLRGLCSGRGVRRGQRVTFVDFEIAYLDEFEYLGPGAVEVEVSSCCSTVSPGTERAVLCGLPGARRAFPYTPGYSFAGVVVAAGSVVRGLQAGDRVAGRMPHASGGCVKADGLFRVPDGVSLEAASFIELGIICLQGIRKARISPGDRVAVLGQGLIGQIANRMAHAAGAGMVIAIAPSRNRAATALATGGADQFGVMRDADFDPTCVAADIVVEAVGTPDAIATAVSLARPGGRVVLLGSSRGLSRDVNLGELLQVRDIEMIGAHISDMPAAEASPGRHTYRQEGSLFLEMLATGSLSVEGLVTWRPAPGECNAVYESIAKGGQEHVAIVFDWTRAPAH